MSTATNEPPRERVREPFAGPDAGPEAPFPIKLQGPVIKGFGRGSKELGIPTANIPPEGLAAYPDLKSGVYYGFVGLSRPPITHNTLIHQTDTDTDPSTASTTPLTPQTPNTRASTVEVYPSVLSIGYNPYYKNTVRSVEIHILHTFTRDFYGAALNLLILGFIRPEYDYVSLDALVTDIKVDCEVAGRSLARDAYEKFKGEEWLGHFEWVKSVDAGEVERRVLKMDVVDKSE